MPPSGYAAAAASLAPHANVPDHYFAPRIEFAPKGDPQWIASAITAWEHGVGPDGPRIIGTNGRGLPEFPALDPGVVEHRWGSFADGSECQYRLRFEVVGARRRVRIGLLLAGPDLPGLQTRGGGELVQRLVANWKHRPQADTFPSGLREVSDPAAVRELFDHLVAPGRATPLVLVTRRSRGEEIVADPERLLDYLAGMAEVWSLPHTTSTFALGQEFASRGFDARWNCYDGGVRLYLPGLDPATDLLGRHPLVLATRLLSQTDPTAATAAWALGAVTRALGVDEWKARWREEVGGRRSTPEQGATLADVDALRRLREVLVDTDPPDTRRPVDEGLDQAAENARAAEAERVVGKDQPATTSEDLDIEADATAPRADADRLRARDDAVVPVEEPDVDVVVELAARAEHEHEHEHSTEPSADAPRPVPRPSRIQRGLASLREAFDSFADLEGLLEELEGELQELRVERDALALERDELSQELQDHEQERAGQDFRLPSTLDDLLALFDDIGGDAIRVTIYARRKARDSKYADLRLLGQVLSVLVAVGPDFGPVHEALSSSLGRRARAKPKESKQTMAKFGQHRKFSLDDGTVAEVEQHVTLGHGKRNLNETLQIYWRRAPDGVTEIVYAGEHLPTVSQNT
jgi:hypothetical protein